MKTSVDLTGKWAVVTGASSGIGEQFAHVLAAKGMNLIIVSNMPEDLNRVENDIVNRHNVDVIALCLDLSDQSSVDKIASVVDEKKLDVRFLINNAGIFDFRPVSDLSPKRIELYLNLHMVTVTRLTDMFARSMAEKGGGYILNMSSMSCWMPMPGIALYSSTKAYIRAFSRALRIEVIGKGVNVTVACPGGIATDLFGLPDNLKRLGVRLGALITPSRFAEKAIKKTIAGKAQYINGMFNRIAIVAVASLPEWVRIKASRVAFKKFVK